MSVWFGVLLATLGCILPISVGGGNRMLPLRSLTMTIDKSQRQELFDQLQKFAEKHEFEFQITDFNTNGENFQVWMSGKDLTITVSNVPPDPMIVYVVFSGKYPGVSVDEDEVEELFSDIKSFIAEIPNVTITEEK